MGRCVTPATNEQLWTMGACRRRRKKVEIPALNIFHNTFLWQEVSRSVDHYYFTFHLDYIDPWHLHDRTCVTQQERSVRPHHRPIKGNVLRQYLLNRLWQNHVFWHVCCFEKVSPSAAKEPWCHPCDIANGRDFRPLQGGITQLSFFNYLLYFYESQP